MTNTQTPATTCQICGRAILANTGVIAHHGYKRPFHRSGIQTRSCEGARYRPYEVSCDRIPSVLAACRNTLDKVNADLAKLTTTPPDVLGYSKEYGNPRSETVWVPRPDDFTPQTPDNYRPRTYAHLYANAIRDHKAQVKYWQDTVDYLTARLAAWVAPAQPVQQ